MMQMKLLMNSFSHLTQGINLETSMEESESIFDSVQLVY